MEKTERYDIEEAVVGHGGFGKVRKGRDTILDRTVAVKVLDPIWKGAEQEDKERFRREAKILAKLSHPNIPAIYDVLFDDDKLEIVFQFVEGQTVRDILEVEETITLAECRLWFDQIASALEHAHDEGIVHRDIKPENMIVTDDRRHCYLVDFGLAISKSELERITGSDDLFGTPGYMSPEHQNGDEVDSSDDLYVLGVCLYEALCGHQLSPGDYDALAAQNELIAPAIDLLVKKCIAKKPQRLQKAADFRRLLRNALTGHRTLSEVLTEGQLHEVADALRNMSPSQLMELRAGQRLLILEKCKNVIADTDGRLAAARREFLVVLPTLGIQLEPDVYESIIKPTIEIGFGEPGDDGVTYRRGSTPICEALVSAASAASGANHHVIVKCLLEWLEDVELESQKTGFYHSVRNLIVPLMANPECDDKDAVQLADVHRKINDLQRAAKDTVAG